MDCLKPSREDDRVQKLKLEGIFDSYDMHQAIKHPTRVTYKTASLIDHIWVSENCKIGDSNTTEGISDHHAIYAVLKAPMEITDRKLKARTYKEYDCSKLIKDYKEETEKSSFKELLKLGNIEEAIKLWMDIVVHLCDRHAPVKDIKIKSKTENVPWYDNNIHALMAAKNKALHKLKTYGNQKSKKILKSISNKLKNYKRKQKRKYFNEKIKEQAGDSKRLWSILKEVSGTESPVEETLPDKIDKDTVNNFNAYFAKVGKTIQNQLGVSFEYVPNNTQGFSFKNETPESVRKLIQRIKPKVATGYDRIPARIVKDLC